MFFWRLFFTLRPHVRLQRSLLPLRWSGATRRRRAPCIFEICFESVRFTVRRTPACSVVLYDPIAGGKTEKAAFRQLFPLRLKTKSTRLRAARKGGLCGRDRTLAARKPSRVADTHRAFFDMVLHGKFRAPTETPLPFGMEISVRLFCGRVFFVPTSSTVVFA